MENELLRAGEDDQPNQPSQPEIWPAKSPHVDIPTPDENPSTPDPSVPEQPVPVRG